MSAEPTFRLAGQEHDVAEVCGMLDGLPLAIELAAVRVKLRSLDRIIDGLRTSLDLLATGSESVPERQRAMTTAIRWSYDRLTSDAQLVCDRLALFERGFTIEAVEAVCPDVPDVIEALASIVDARLVRQMESRADVRFVVLGTVRAFASERLLARPDLMRSRELLAAYLTRRAEDSRAQLYGADGDLAQARFDDNAADIAAAVDWALESGRRSIAVELMLAGVDCWVAAGRQNQALGLVVLVLDHVPQQAPEAARLLAAASMLSHQLSDHDQALTYARAALALAERHGDRISASTARTFLAAELMFSGELAEGLALAREAAAEAEALDLYPLSAQALGARDGEGHQRRLRRRAAGLRGPARRWCAPRATWPAPPTRSTAWRRSPSTTADGETRPAPSPPRRWRSPVTRLPTVARDASITLARAALAHGDLVEAGRRLARGPGPERPPRAEVRRRAVPARRRRRGRRPRRGRHGGPPVRCRARACRRHPAAATCRRSTTSRRRWPRHEHP